MCNDMQVVEMALMIASLLQAFATFFQRPGDHRNLHSFPTRRSSDLADRGEDGGRLSDPSPDGFAGVQRDRRDGARSEEHTSELQSRFELVCRLLLEKKNQYRRGPLRRRTDSS